ncbi:MAG: S9 family peptidase [Myxococcales bacterium]|nr:S9 family peptidase [Myxococcales bacterium]
MPKDHHLAKVISGVFVALLQTGPVVASEASQPSSPKREWPSNQLTPKDIFELEWVASPHFAPNGKQIVYLRRSFDIMTDRAKARLWVVATDGSNHRPLLSDFEQVSSPRWSPSGDRILFISKTKKAAQLFVLWPETGHKLAVTHVPNSPSQPVWSPDGQYIAFTMPVESPNKPMITMPKKPKGATWAPSAKVINRTVYRADGRGYLPHSFTHLFVVPAYGGTARQLTSGDFNHGQPSWSKDGKKIYISGQRQKNWVFEPRNQEIFEINVSSGKLRSITKRFGPDNSPKVSPNGKYLAFLGFDDKMLGFQPSELYISDTSGKNQRRISQNLDRTIDDVQWASDSNSLYIQYTDHGVTKLANISMSGKIHNIANHVGGTTLGRPYSSGAFTVSTKKDVAFTQTSPTRPASLAIVRKNGKSKTLVRLNEDLLGHKQLASLEEMEIKTIDGEVIQGWIAKPPQFDDAKKYPLILEIHGGPFANYGPRFAAEIQLYASAGFVVLYINPRGSTSYGSTFSNHIHHAYPGEDYGDLMAAVDEVISRDYIDENRLFITGGSGGGTLTAWVIGKTARFKAAVVAKPVINWISFALYADYTPFFTQYWFPGMPWERPDHYFQRSPLSSVGNVKTPTMLLTGEVDYRTPIAESEQYYQALKLRKIDASLVRIGGASHNIGARPSHLIAKVLHILAWFDKYDKQP